MGDKTILDHSEIESELLGLKVGRCNATLFDESVLFNSMVSGGYDLCRLKVSAADEMATAKLTTLGIPFSFSGSIRRYKTKISEPPAGSYIYPDLEYELYDGTQDKLLKFMLTDTWGAYPIGYYRSPLLCKLVDKRKEIDCVFRYYKKHNNHRENPNSSILFIRHKDNYVGFFALNVIAGNLESHIGGICKKYQESGYFHDMLRYIKEYCIRHRLKHFIFGARNENTQVQRIFEKAGFSGHDSENVFHIAGLLTLSKNKPLKTEIKSKDEWTAGSVSRQLMKIAENRIKLPSGLPNGYSLSLKFIDGKKLQKNLSVLLTIPVKDKNELMAVFKLYDHDKRLYAIGYLDSKLS